MRLLLILLISLISIVSKAQMHMDHMSKPKQVYLVMMDDMMKKMDAAGMTKSADVDFTKMMLPHHHGAVAMAKYEIAHGKNFGMIQLAKSILAEQQIDIQQMKLWLAQNRTAKFPANTLYQKPLMLTMDVMMQHMPPEKQLTDNDKAFAAVMIPHHQAAIDMAKVELAYGTDKSAKRLAENIISAEKVELEQMRLYNK